MTQFVSHYQIKEQPTTTYSINENGKDDNQFKYINNKSLFLFSRTWNRKFIASTPLLIFHSAFTLFISTLGERVWIFSSIRDRKRCDKTRVYAAICTAYVCYYTYPHIRVRKSFQFLSLTFFCFSIFSFSFLILWSQVRAT
jgi:hypothetical protein